MLKAFICLHIFVIIYAIRSAHVAPASIFQISLQPCSLTNQKIRDPVSRPTEGPGIVGEQPSDIVKSMPHFAAGVVAGVLECLVGHPLDTIRVVAMSGTDKQSSSAITAFVSACSSKSGFWGLYRGAWSEVLSSAAAGSALFGVNDLIKRVFGKTCDDEDIEAVDSKLLGAAAITGFLDGVVCKPFELVKSRQQFVPEWSSRTGWQCARDVWYQEGGAAGFFRGWLPTVMRETIGNVAFFAAYHQSKIFLHARNRMLLSRAANAGRAAGSYPTVNRIRDGSFMRRRLSNNTIALLAGAAAGLAYVVSSQPLELASILMQTDHPVYDHRGAASLAVGTAVPIYKYQSMSDCVASVVKSHGVRGLYKGSVPTVLRALPTYAAAIWGYELTLRGIHALQEKGYIWKKYPYRRHRERREDDVVSAP